MGKDSSRGRGRCRDIVMVSIKGKGGITGWGRCRGRDKLMSRLDLGLGIVVGLLVWVGESVGLGVGVGFGRMLGVGFGVRVGD